MSIPPYTPMYPPDGSSLGATKSTIRANLDGTFQTLGVDHFNNNGINGTLTGPAGYHAQVRMPAQSGIPVTASGQLALYAQLGEGGTELFMVREGNPATAVQLTVASSTFTNIVAATNGFTFLPGGLLLQWGMSNVTTPNNVNTIAFNTAFLEPAYNVSLTIRTSGTSNHASSAYVIGTTATNFTMDLGDVPSNITGFYWQAIGLI